MTGPAPRDDFLARERAGLAHDQALVDTRRRAALNYLSARVQNSCPRLAGDLNAKLLQALIGDVLDARQGRQPGAGVGSRCPLSDSQ